MNLQFQRVAETNSRHLWMVTNEGKRVGRVIMDGKDSDPVWDPDTLTIELGGLTQVFHLVTDRGKIVVDRPVWDGTEKIAFEIYEHYAEKLRSLLCG